MLFVVWVLVIGVSCFSFVVRCVMCVVCVGSWFFFLGWFGNVCLFLFRRSLFDVRFCLLFVGCFSLCGRWVFVVACSLFMVRVRCRLFGCWVLLVIGCGLPIVLVVLGYVLFMLGYCILFRVRCLVLGGSWLLFVVYCLMFVLGCSLFVVFWLMVVRCLCVFCCSSVVACCFLLFVICRLRFVDA